MVIQRIGGVCSGLFANLAHSPIGTLNIALASPPPPPPPPPANPWLGKWVGTRTNIQTNPPFVVALIFTLVADQSSPGNYRFGISGMGNCRLSPGAGNTAFLGFCSGGGTDITEIAGIRSGRTMSGTMDRNCRPGSVCMKFTFEMTRQ